MTEQEATGEWPIPKVGEEKLRTEVTQSAKKRLVDYIPEGIRPVMSNALGQVIGSLILALIVWLASQGIIVDLNKNTEAAKQQTEAIQKANRLHQIELEAWGVTVE